jgi:phosphatidylglycerol:prolipoprotein diacylglycerol transferase
MMALGVASAFWFVYVQAKKQGLPASRLIDMAFYTVIISLIGAKLILFIGHFSHYTKYPSELFTLARSGGVFQGGLAFGIAFALWYFHKYRIPTWKVGDLAGPALALGHGFGRIGCFAAGCCFGRGCTTALGVEFHNEYAHQLTGIDLHTPIHPVQLYESALNFLNFIILFVILKRKSFDGQVFGFYIMNYSIIRYFTEFYRGDHPDRAVLIQGASPYLSLTLPQLFCVLGFLGGLALYFFLKKRKRA